MEKIVSVDVNITDELSLSKHEDVEGNEQGGKIIQEDVASIEAKDEKKKEDITIEEAKEEIASPAEDKGLHDTTDVPNTQPAEASEASISQDPVEAPKEIAQESFEISNSSQSNANDTKDPVGAPKELEISETATEEEQSVQESTADVSATDDKLPEPLSEFVISTNGGESPFEAPKEHVISEIVDVSATDDKLPEPLSEFVISINGGESPFEAPKEHVISEIVDVSATDDKLPEPLSEFVISTNGGESPFETPKEPVISEIVAEEVKGVVEESSQVPGEDSSNVVKDDNRVEQVPEAVSQEPSEATLVTTTGAEEKPADEEVTDDTVEVSRHVPKEELPHSGATEPTECPVNKVHEIAQSESSDVVPTEPKQVQIETIVAELPSQKIDEERHAESHTQVVSEPEGETVVVSSDDTPTSEVVEGIADPETEAKKKDQENNIDNEKITLTETAQSIAEGVEVSEDAENKILQVQNPNLVELTRDIKMVGVETDAPSDNQLETESKPNKQTLQDKFANENTEEKKQETAQVDTGILTETNDATKADEAATKELSGKKSKTIMSKVKQSIVKVKKALIGKSPSSKTMAPEGIDDTKAK